MTLPDTPETTTPTPAIPMVSTQAPAPATDNLRLLTHVIYGLHAFSAVAGLTSAAFVVTSFLSGWPSIIAVILNYLKRSEVRGTWLESHFRWQIRTFWFAFLWMIVSGLLLFTVIGIPVALGIMLITGLWVVYRIARGWLALNDNKPMPSV